ncbi:MAG: PSD1 and planctomycete cytochrome C domain-containing protein [Gemmataceae bacterium]
MTRALVLLAFVPVAVRADDRVDYNRDVRPILSDACFSCHGFDAKARKAKLRLDTPDGATKERNGVVPIKPGDPTESEVWARLTSTDPDLVMPPPDSKKSLTAAQKATLRKWIEQGAKYQKHWSFEPVRRPARPWVSPAGTPIDTFLNAKLRAAGLTPQPEADRATLIRRVAFTLTGLPPTVKEVDVFLADKAPGAYERMVDTYLASPRYGEEMARHWLDAARYADTHGLHLDNERQMWPYRDWVVKAFNDNLPFDRFTVWQVAGDLLPNPTPEQRVATGFNRCNVTTSEGGAIDAEYRHVYAIERTSTVVQVWLGLTAGCAVCHDHKYDPLSMKEFYSLYAFFNSAADPAMDGNIDTTPPFLKVPDPKLKVAAEAAGRVEKEARAWLDAVADLTAYTDPAAEFKLSNRKPVRDVLVDDAAPVGTATRSSTRNSVHWVADPGFKAASGRRVIRQASAVGYSDTFEFRLRPVVVPHGGEFEVWVRPEAKAVPASVSVSVPGKGSVTLARGDQGLSRGSLVATPGEWTKLTFPAADLGLKPGDRLPAIALSQTGGIVFWDGLTLSGQTVRPRDPQESLDAWRRTAGVANAPDLPADIGELLRAGPKKALTPDERTRLTRFYLAVIARPAGDEWTAARAAWQAARTARLTAEDAAPGTFVFAESAKPRDTFVMLRGQYDKPGEKVVPGVPAVLPPLGKTGRATRLDLARWLVAPENPLTARVAVNRLWQQVFGTGLVKTSGDFGAQGEPPSHPELLDWLAAEFRDSDWDVKRTVRLMVLSDAFRRDARQTHDARAKDPDNRLYARGPRVRLDAEQVRDNALFASGLMVGTMGGPGVKPYQPPNIWEPVGYADSNTRFYLQDHGPALYRRSLYTFLKRTAPPPFLTNFDGTNREQVCVARERTNTPLQALQLMNDVQFFEAARALAERAVAAGLTPEDRVVFLYRTVLARRPDAVELKVVTAAYEKQFAIYRADPAAAKKVVHAGESQPRGVAPDAEVAAWTMVANLILNLDETVTRN